MSDHPSEPSSRIKRILLVRTDRLGDVVLTLPMLTLLRKTFPDAHIALLLSRYTGEIVEGNPYANALIWYDNGRRPIRFRAVLRALRENHFDVAVVVHPTLRLGWLMFRAGIPVRIGSGYRVYSFLFNRPVYEHRKDARRHEMEYNLRLLAPLGCPIPADGAEQEFFIAIPPTARQKAEELLRSRGFTKGDRFAVLHPSSGGSAREWPAEYFGMLAEKLAAGRGLRSVVTGAKGDEAQVAEVVARSGGKAVSLAGLLGLKELAALIREAALFVSNSTGPLHIAVAVGTPVLGFYPQIRPMSAQRWGPATKLSRVLVPDKPIDCRECSGGKGERCDCMASISVDRAYGAACSLLESARAPQKGAPSNA